MFRLDTERLTLSFTIDDRDLAFELAKIEGFVPVDERGLPIHPDSELEQVAPGIWGLRVTRARAQTARQKQYTEPRRRGRFYAAGPA